MGPVIDKVEPLALSWGFEILLALKEPMNV
ncbi:hypothetical protein PMIT1320_00965 [Prochlorococcus marinus str. MIT 1320]|nr:hypothetical protein PMIT1320_00965 [Prochlorococcus marinus str. MIT 1320]